MKNVYIFEIDIWMDGGWYEIVCRLYFIYVWLKNSLTRLQFMKWQTKCMYIYKDKWIDEGRMRDVQVEIIRIGFNRWWVSNTNEIVLSSVNWWLQKYP